MSSYHELIKQAETKVDNGNLSVSSIKLLMYELTQNIEIDLYANYHQEADQKITKLFLDGVDRLIKNEPLAYILGYQWFYGRKFKVDHNVFIPRYETEELCAYVLEAIDEFFASYQKIDVADIACGSGAIAITIACEEPKGNCYATELNIDTIYVAKDNAKEHQAAIKFYNGDMLNPLINDHIKLDVLISNPPYIKTTEILDASVVEHEPNMALFGGEDGLQFYRIILSEAHKVIKERSMLAFEIGYQQKDDILALAEQYFPSQRKEVIKDLNGKDRMLFIYVNLGR